MSEQQDFDGLLQEAGAGDLVGEMDGLPPLPKPEAKAKAGEIQNDGEENEGDLLDGLGIDQEGEGEEEPGEEEPPRSREAQLARENSRLYSMVDNLLAKAMRDPGREEAPPPRRMPTFELDFSKLTPPAGVDADTFKEALNETNPIITAALGQFFETAIAPMMEQQQQIAGMLGEMHLAKNVQGYTEPKTAAMRQRLFASMPKDVRDAWDNTYGASMLTLAAEGALAREQSQKGKRAVSKRRSVTEGAGGVAEREEPSSQGYNKIKRFTREATDDQFEAMTERLERSLSSRR